SKSVFHLSGPRRVCTAITPEEKRPNSLSYGFARTDTDSMALDGNVGWARFATGSTSETDCTWKPTWLGRPPSMLAPVGSWMTWGIRRSADWTPPPGRISCASLCFTDDEVERVPDAETTGEATT